MSQSFQQYSELADLMLELQMAMQEAHVWECQPPTPQALASDKPFCIDTMTFEQWLRYVMIERFKDIIEQQLSLPERCHISPMIEEAFRGLPSAQVKHLMLVADALDRFLTRTATV
ncbi:YqcC family protein [Marinomonas ostreistagni]|uniref:YqcC family protein n=1 Tax=Marinomonas ostreistagni TaxID=359209 RepID=UPI00194E9199|nr:YqcC family protein [Marinomonas ostreistagni]MBM6551950.1 YqcC family protein [Marinomonas ostreistagni]